MHHVPQTPSGNAVRKEPRRWEGRTSAPGSASAQTATRIRSARRRGRLLSAFLRRSRTSRVSLCSTFRPLWTQRRSAAMKPIADATARRLASHPPDRRPRAPYQVPNKDRQSRLIAGSLLAEHPCSPSLASAFHRETSAKGIAPSFDRRAGESTRTHDRLHAWNPLRDLR